MAIATADNATQAVKDAEKIVADAAKSESKGSVSSITTESGTARAWDAKAQID
jgi:hypothetical protein